MAPATETILRLAVLLLPVLAMSQAIAGDMVIVKDGQPQATIVVSTQEDEKTAVAAEDLQSYIEKMSGAKLLIVTDDSNPQGALILVGKSSLTDKMNVAIPSGLTNSRREEGFVISCKADRLVLAGNNEGPYHGTEYAVYDFLNRLGVRWFMPGDLGEYVPKKTTITFPEITIGEKPDFVMRNWWCHQPADRAALEYRWKLRNKMNSDVYFGGVIDGSAKDLLTDNDFKNNPEWFAMNSDGTRNRNLPSLTNPDTVKAVAATIKDYFRKNPDAHAYGFAPDDGVPRDYDPETLKLNRGFVTDGGRPGVPEDFSITEEWINFVNNLTAEVRKEFPDVYLATNGYANRYLPPQGVKPDDHLVIMYANIMTCSRHSYDHPGCWIKARDAKMIEQWCKLSKNVWLYNYIEQMMVSGLAPIPEVHKLRREFPLWKKWGVMGMHDESRNALMECGIHSRYLRAKLEWNADADVDTILNDYFTHWYSGAAKPMMAFYEAIENAFDTTPIHGHEDRILPEVYTPKLIAELARHLASAEKLADSERAKQHVQADRLIYQYLQAYMAMTNAELSCNFAEAAKQAAYMMNLRKKINALNPFLVPEGELPYPYWPVTHRQEYYQSLADMTSGKTGDIVAVLPMQAMFKTDPKDDGVIEEWYAPDLPQNGWKPILTTRPFYMQGYQDKDCYPYVGNIWYRLTVDVPASAIGKKVMLYSTVLETEGWVWVNGEFAGYRPYAPAYVRPNQLDVDVSSALRPGKNTIVIRVNTSLGAAQAASGLLSGLFLYSPKAEE